MEKIKIKDIEGPVDQLIELFKTSGCDLNQYINPDAKPIKTLNKWYVIGSTILFCVLCGILYSHPMWSDVLMNILTFCALVVGLLSIFFVHMHFHERGATILAFLIFSIISVVAYHIISPEDATKEFKKASNIFIENNVK